MTMIEHFLTDIMHISLRDWIEHSIGDIGREVAPTDIFQPTLHNVFLKTLAGRQWFFFSAEVVFLFWCCIRNVQCRSARFYCASSTDVFFRPKLSSSHLFGKKTLAHLGKKIFFTDIDWKNWQSTSARKDDRSRSKKEASPHDADRTFPYRHHAYFIKGLNRILNRRHRSWSSPDWYFSADIAQFFFKNVRWPIMFFFTAGKVFLFWCCIKNVQCRLARFFCASSTDVLFRAKLACCCCCFG